MSRVTPKTPDQIEQMYAACRLTASILDEVGSVIKPGASTEDIDRFVRERMQENGALAATLNYKGFPKSCCTSVNDVICHGIPSTFAVLKEGDIVNVDVTSILDGWHGDASRMYFVGGQEAISDEAKQVVEICKGALNAGIDEVAPGKRLGDIGAGIQSYIKKKEQETGLTLGIVKEYTGHGIGQSFHEEPQVIHVGKRGKGIMFKEGMTFTVEPMINLGSHKTKLSQLDGWTVRTVDGGLSAQWEHTIVVTKDGAEKMTQSLNGMEY